MAYTSGSQQPSRLSSIALDSPPPSPRPRVKPGDDTNALLGESFEGDGEGISANTPMGKALAGLSMMMSGVNLVESVTPGAIPPPVIQIIQQLMQTLPEMVNQMATAQTDPSMLMNAASMQPGAMPPSANIGASFGSPMSGPRGMEGAMGGMRM